MPYRKRKASEVFSESYFPFAPKVSFEEAFPEIKAVKVLHRPVGAENWSARTRVGEYVDCTNALCHNGGFSVGEILRAMVAREATDHEGLQVCQGNEGSPKGRRIYRKCMKMWDVKVHIDYRGPRPAEAIADDDLDGAYT